MRLRASPAPSNATPTPTARPTSRPVRGSVDGVDGSAEEVVDVEVPADAAEAVGLLPDEAVADPEDEVVVGAGGGVLVEPD